MSDLREDPWLTDLAEFAATFEDHPDVAELRHRAQRIIGAHTESTDLAELAFAYEDNADHRAELIRSAREVLGKSVHPMVRSRRILIGAYLATFGGLLLAITPWAWSVATAAISRAVVPASFLGIRFEASGESALAAIVILMAFLGSIAVLILTFTNRAGHETLERGYLWWYFTRPVAAAAVAVLFYMVIFAGYFDQATKEGRGALIVAAAIGGLAGLFTDKVLQTMRGVLGQTPFTKSTTNKGQEPEQ